MKSKILDYFKRRSKGELFGSTLILLLFGNAIFLFNINSKKQQQTTIMFSPEVVTSLAYNDIPAKSLLELHTFIKNNKSLTVKQVQGLMAVPNSKFRKNAMRYLYNSTSYIREDLSKDSLLSIKVTKKLLQEKYSYTNLMIDEYLRFVKDTTYYPKQIIVTTK